MNNIYISCNAMLNKLNFQIFYSYTYIFQNVKIIIFIHYSLKLLSLKCYKHREFHIQKILWYIIKFFVTNISNDKFQFLKANDLAFNSIRTYINDNFSSEKYSMHTNLFFLFMLLNYFEISLIMKSLLKNLHLKMTAEKCK